MLLLTACATVDVPTQDPAEVEDRVIIDGEVLPLPDEPEIRAEPLAGGEQMSPVVAKLMVSADTERRTGNLDAAANALERALRIEPRNALLWSRLADIRYSQKNWQQSIQLATKSNTLARSDDNLRRQNWYLMVNAYQAIGDQANAEKYRQKLSGQ